MGALGNFCLQQPVAPQQDAGINPLLPVHRAIGLVHPWAGEFHHPAKVTAVHKMPGGPQYVRPQDLP